MTKSNEYVIKYYDTLNQLIEAKSDCNIAKIWIESAMNILTDDYFSDKNKIKFALERLQFALNELKDNK